MKKLRRKKISPRYRIKSSQLVSHCKALKKLKKKHLIIMMKNLKDYTTEKYISDDEKVREKNNFLFF